MKPSILIFSEDPGAVNCILPLLPLLQQATIPFRLLAAGTASGMYAAKGFQPDSFEEIDELFAKDVPALVLTGTAANLDTAGLRLIDAARERGIPTLGIVDAPMNADLRFCGRSGSPLTHAPDIIAVPDQVCAERFKALGVGSSQISICGHPHYDAVRTRAEAVRQLDRCAVRKKFFSEINEGQQLILFAGEPETHHQRNADYLLHGRGKRNGRIEIVMEEFLDATAGLIPRPARVLQLHPRSNVKDVGALAGEFDSIHQGGDLLEILYCADVVAGLTSMLLMEAALMGTPTLAIIPRTEEKEWLPSIGWGATVCATDRAQLGAVLRGFNGEISVEPFGDKLICGAAENLCELIKGILFRKRMC